MLSFQCQVLLCLPGRDCLHSCEIRWSPQPKLRTVALPQPWQSKQESESQRQPQSQQFPWPWQSIAPLLTSSQSFSLPFLNFTAINVLPLWCIPSCFYFWVSPDVSCWVLSFPFLVLMSWLVLVCRCTLPPSFLPFSLPSSLDLFPPPLFVLLVFPLFLSSLCFSFFFYKITNCAVINFKNVETSWALLNVFASFEVFCSGVSF